LKNWKQTLATKAKTQVSGGSEPQKGGNPWEFIGNCVGKSAGDYKGSKDVSRMRDAILHKSKDK
jgi:hypothetical protein